MQRDIHQMNAAFLYCGATIFYEQDVSHLRITMQ